MKNVFHISLLTVFLCLSGCSNTTDDSNNIDNSIVLSWNKDVADDSVIIDDNKITFGKTKYVSCGPYTVVLQFKLKENVESLSIPVTLVDIGYSGKVSVNKDGYLVIGRRSEYRYIRQPEKKGRCNIFGIDTNDIHTLEMGWDGEFMYSTIDSTNKVVMQSNGTQVMQELRINTSISDLISVLVTCP